MTLEAMLKKYFGKYDRFDVMRWLINGQRRVNKNEQMSILSLLAYAAVETDTPLEELKNRFLEAFNISRVEQLKSDDCEDAVRFVMEWKAAEADKQAIA